MAEENTEQKKIKVISMTYREFLKKSKGIKFMTGIEYKIIIESENFIFSF